MSQDVLVLSHCGGGALREALTDAGLCVHVASTAAEAARLVRENPVRLAFLEAGDHDSRLRARDEILQVRPECRVAIVQGFEDAKGRGQISHLGVSDYIVNGSDLARLAGRAFGDDKPDADPATGPSLLKALSVAVGLLEASDPFFVGNTSRVARLVDAIAEQMELPELTRNSIAVAALLRDLGNAAVPQDILDHPERLSLEQRERLQRHVHWSVRLLEHIEFPGKVMSVVRHHHERYDGKGYPDGLKGRQIPLGSRIIAAAEAFTAMISPRPHRPGQGRVEAVAELMAAAGTQLDPEIVESLVAVLNGETGAVSPPEPRAVLLIDPDREIRALLKMRLVQEGYRVSEVSPPIAADLLESSPADLILCDAGDGGAGALGLLESLRLRQDGQPVPFALLVAGNDRDLMRKAFRYGVDDVIDKMSELEDIVGRIGNILAREDARSRMAATATLPSGITGELDNLPLPEIIQILCMGEKTASVQITSGERTGTLWFEKGAVVHAVSGRAEGEEAFTELVSWQKGTFLIRHGEDAPRTTIESDPMMLLLEHCRALDETSAIVDAALGTSMSADPASETAR